MIIKKIINLVAKMSTVGASCLFSLTALAALPTSIQGVTVNENDPIGSLWALFKLFIFYGSWGSVVIGLVAGGYYIVGALGESRKRNDSSILWSTVMNVFAVLVILVIISILITNFIA